MTVANRRLCRAKKTRALIKKHGKARVCVVKSNQHIEAYLFDAKGQVLASQSTKGAQLKALKANNGSNIDAAKKVGTSIAQQALKLGVSEVAFDRSGYVYHGRIKALADAAREAGLKF